jgi:hypothetical protein
MNNLVFLGAHTFRFDLPCAEVDGPGELKIFGFEAALRFSAIEELHSVYDPAFSYVQVVRFTDGELRPSSCAALVCAVPAHEEAVDWILCFPVATENTEDDDDGERGRRYVLQTYTVAPDGDDMLYTFSSIVGDASTGYPFQAAPSLEGLRHLSPQHLDSLVVLRASGWRWDKQRDTALVLLEDVIEMETIFGSEARVF